MEGYIYAVVLTEFCKLSVEVVLVECVLAEIGLVEVVLLDSSA